MTFQSADFKSAAATDYATLADEFLGNLLTKSGYIVKQKSPIAGADDNNLMEARPGVEPG